VQDILVNSETTTMASTTGDIPKGEYRSETDGGGRLNPAELKIDLLCCGLRIDPDCRQGDDTAGYDCPEVGLGSGLELLLPGDKRQLWVNVPVREKFVEKSPYLLSGTAGEFGVHDEKKDIKYRVELPQQPDWYRRKTTRGAQMSDVGILNGTCLSVYIGDLCQFWSAPQSMNCKFCNIGLDPAFSMERTVDDVVETAMAAQEQSKVTFTILSSGYQGAKGLAKVFPYLKALKSRTDLLVGIQFIPEPELSLYDQVIDLGVDHLSFCFEFYNADYFQRYLPGKSEEIGRKTFFRAIEYCARKLGRGRVSGEIIAGVEPLGDTLRAIDYIGFVGAYPVVCIFRPLEGADMEEVPTPDFHDMVKVYRHVYKTCKAHRLPIGVAPNINYSLSLQPEDTFYLASDQSSDRAYSRWLWMLRQVMRPRLTHRKPKK
jgi:hypothetical protein